MYYHDKKSAVTSDILSTTQYCAPTVGLEDNIFTFGKTKDTAKFKLVKDKLGKNFATQTWNNVADAARAFDTSKESVYIEPNEPHFPN